MSLKRNAGWRCAGVVRGSLKCSFLLILFIIFNVTVFPIRFKLSKSCFLFLFDWSFFNFFYSFDVSTNVQFDLHIWSNFRKKMFTITCTRNTLCLHTYENILRSLSVAFGGRFFFLIFRTSNFHVENVAQKVVWNVSRCIWWNSICCLMWRDHKSNFVHILQLSQGFNGCSLCSQIACKMYTLTEQSALQSSLHIFAKTQFCNTLNQRHFIFATYTFS